MGIMQNSITFICVMNSWQGFKVGLGGLAIFRPWSTARSWGTTVLCVSSNFVFFQFLVSNMQRMILRAKEAFPTPLKESCTPIFMGNLGRKKQMSDKVYSRDIVVVLTL